MNSNQTRANGKPPPVDAGELERALRLLHGDRPMEVRCVKLCQNLDDWPETKAGYFRDATQAAHAVAALRYARGAVYVSLQQIRPSIVSRCVGRLATQRGKDSGALTNDGDVEAYQWLLIDLDYQRAEGIMATDAEHAAAADKAAEVAYELEQIAWGRPMRCDSGSGAHLLYRTDLAATSKPKYQAILETLQYRFGSDDRDGVKVDRTVFNPSRVVRFYGTWNRKGDDDQAGGRPHRQSRIVQAPAELVTITEEMIDHINTEWGTPQQATKGHASRCESNAAWSKEKLDQWLRDRLPSDCGVSGPHVSGDGWEWTFARCPTCTDHGGNYNAGVRLESCGRITYHCFGERCAGIHWTQLRDKYEPDRHQRRDESPVDISKIMATSGESSGPSRQGIDDEEPNVAPVANLPQSLLKVPGFIAEVVEYTLAVAPYPNHVLAFAGAVSLLAMLTGRKVRDETNMRTNLMLLALAGSASGKDYPRKVNTEILKQLGAMDCLGDTFASGQGLEDALFANPTMLFQTDEIDTLIQSVAKSRDGSQEATISALLKLHSSANSTYPMRRKAGQPASYIEQPHLCVFGTAIPEMFYASLTERMLTNGLFARMIVLEAGPRGRGQDAKPIVIPEGIMEAARDWRTYSPGPGNLSMLNPTPSQIRSTNDARRLRRETREAAEDEYSQAETRHDVTAMAVWGRAPEQAAKLALLYACSKTHPQLGEPVVDKDACQWAQDFAFHQVRRMLDMVRGHVAETEFERNCLKTLRRLTQRKPEGMEHWKLLKQSKLPAKEFRDVIQTLHERRQIDTKVVGNRGQIYFAQ